MFSGKTEHPQKSTSTSTLQIKQDDKFFCRLLSKENSSSSSMSQPSFRRASVAVPFVWESQPGTPKHTFSEHTLPPLTPPPSFYFNSNKKPVKKRSRSNLFFALFPKLMNLKKTTPSLSSSPPSSFSSLSSSSDSSKLGRRQFRRCGSSIDFIGDEEEEEEGVGVGVGVGGACSPNSILCFRGSCRR